jgi:hypothetical protein
MSGQQGRSAPRSLEGAGTPAREERAGVRVNIVVPGLADTERGSARVIRSLLRPAAR